jgi:Tol biopolymer transport system component
MSKLEWVGRGGKVLGTLGEPVTFPSDLRLSPDQKRLALAIFEGSNRDVWIYDVARGLRTRFTFDPLLDDGPLWSPDGSAIVWSSRRSGFWALFRKPSDGSGTDQILYGDSADFGNKIATSWSPDGKFLLYTTNHVTTGNDVWVLPLTSEQPGAPPKPFPFVQSPFQEGYAVFSPDGKWVAYQSNESGQLEVYVIPFNGVSSGAGGKRQISNHGGASPRWRADGKEIFYLSSGQLMAADVNIRNGTLESGRIQVLFGGIGTTAGYPYDVSRDGQKFIVVRDLERETSGAPPLTLVQNWTALLKK